MTSFEATPSATEKDDDEAELNRLKIQPTVTYSWGGYRYSNARDAIAAARRAERP